MNRFSHAPDIIDRISGLSSAIWTYAGVAACFELGIVDGLGAPVTAAELAGRLDLDAELVADLIGVLAALGAVERAPGGEGAARWVATPAFESFRSGALGRVTRAGIRSDHLQTSAALRRARAGTLDPGWDHLDPDVLVAQGETAGLFRLAAEHVLPSLPGLGAALHRPGARFLDVGAGVGVISSELCMVYPELVADCLEPNAAARRIGRERIRDAGLAERIGYRADDVESLDAIRRYDLALVPQPFLAGDAFEAGLTTVGRALRGGGWMLVLALDVPEADPVAAASSRVRARLWGGGAIDSGELIDRLARSGFEDARAHPPVGGYRMFAARVPEHRTLSRADPASVAVRA
jgi:SAM-dependent methyltransferase